MCILHKVLTNNLAYILRERKGLAVSLMETMPCYTFYIVDLLTTIAGGVLFIL